MRTFLLAAMLSLAACQPAPPAQTEQKESPHSQPKSDPVRQLACKGPSDFTNFTATLDGSGYDAASGFFNVIDANIIDNYATARLLCTGYSLEKVDCIGFWFGIGEYVTEVTLAKDGAGGFSASYAPLKGIGPLMHSGPWACTVN